MNMTAAESWHLSLGLTQRTERHGRAINAWKLYMSFQLSMK